MNEAILVIIVCAVVAIIFRYVRKRQSLNAPIDIWQHAPLPSAYAGIGGRVALLLVVAGALGYFLYNCRLVITVAPV